MRAGLVVLVREALLVLVREALLVLVREALLVLVREALEQVTQPVRPAAQPWLVALALAAGGGGAVQLVQRTAAQVAQGCAAALVKW